LYGDSNPSWARNQEIFAIRVPTCMYRDLGGYYIHNKMEVVRINQANIRVSSNGLTVLLHQILVLEQESVS
jgi:hypothetical protein